MQFIKKEDAPEHKNSPACTAVEYAFKNEAAINIATIHLNGRYPETGYALNKVVKELMYVVRGSGSLTTAKQHTPLNEGDAVLIQPTEAYYLQGEMTLIIPSTPAWYAEQHTNISEL